MLTLRDAVYAFTYAVFASGRPISAHRVRLDCVAPEDRPALATFVTSFRRWVVRPSSPSTAN